jgi:hypothetical protein
LDDPAVGRVEDVVLNYTFFRYVEFSHEAVGPGSSDSSTNGTGRDGTGWDGLDGVDGVSEGHDPVSYSRIPCPSYSSPS